MRNHCRSETLVNELEILVLYTISKCENATEIVLEARCNDKVSKSVKNLLTCDCIQWEIVTYMNTSYWKCLVFTCKSMYSIIWMIADFDNNMAGERDRNAGYF